ARPTPARSRAAGRSPAGARGAGRHSSTSHGPPEPDDRRCAGFPGCDRTGARYALWRRPAASRTPPRPQGAGMALLETRKADLFPVLGAFQIEAARRFASGPPRTFAAGALLYDVGEPSPTAWLVLTGTIEILRRDALGHSSVLMALQPGQFTGE